MGKFFQENYQEKLRADVNCKAFYIIALTICQNPCKIFSKNMKQNIEPVQSFS